MSLRGGIGCHKEEKTVATAVCPSGMVYKRGREEEEEEEGEGWRLSDGRLRLIADEEDGEKKWEKSMSCLK